MSEPGVEDAQPDTYYAEDYDPAYPGSTPEAPYGFKPDGTPYKRRPKGTAGSSAVKALRTAATPKQAESAAAVLGKANVLSSMALSAVGFPRTGAQLLASNTEFEALAAEALAHDPALCKRILSLGGTGAKAGLAGAYGVLALSLMPTLRDEYGEKVAAAEALEEGE